MEIFNAIVNFFKNAGTVIGTNLLTIIGLSVTLTIILVSLIVAYFSVESVTNRKVKQINRYLLDNPFVNDENIVEFNRIMKNRMPKNMRYQWQKYMVNRQQKPSEYLTEDNCITKPFRTSAFVQCLKQLKYIVGFFAIIVFMFTMGSLASSSLSVMELVLRSSIVPLIMVALTILFASLMSARRNALLNDLFYNFDQMQHSLDRAVVSFPPFVDYEILFTKKEIADGIPALQEYLQQRAIYEQEQLEKARLSQVEHENYDFSKLGVKGSLIMDRAMKECEFYLGNRKILLADIDSLQTQKDLLTKNYEEKNKSNQRKLRDIKETIDRLREKLNTTTNKIVGNDIIKQQADEVKKQQVIEKEMEDDGNRYNQDLQRLELQINGKRAEIENNKNLVEKTLVNDFKGYSDKIYEELKKIADSHVFEEMDKLKNEKDKLERELEDREQYIIKKNAMYEEKVKENATVQDLKHTVDDLKRDIAIKNQEIIGANKEVESRANEINVLKREIERLRKAKYSEVSRYFDSDGMEFFYDPDGNPYYYNKEGVLSYYTDEEKIKQLKAYKKRDEDKKRQELEQLNAQNMNNQQPAQEENASTDENKVEKVESSKENEPVVLPLTNEERPVVVEEIVTEQPVQENEDKLSLSDDELKALDNLEVSDEQAQKNIPAMVEEQPSQEVQDEKPVEDVAVVEEKPVEDKAEAEEEKQTEVVAPAEEVSNEKEAVQEALPEVKDEDDKQNEQDKIDAQLTREIEERTRTLEQQYKELQQQIEKAEVVAEKPVETKTVVKKSPAKKSTAKKPASKKTVKKPTAKKPATKKAATAKKPTAKKPVVAVVAKKPKKKKPVAFSVKPAPQGLDNSTFDFSAFADLTNQEPNKNLESKPADNSGDKK